MKIQNNHVVSIHYTLKNNAGDIIDSSAGRDPLDYIQGKGMIVPGLEKAMLGRSLGEKFSVKVIPSEGYGEFSPDMVQEVPLAAFEGVPEVKAGMEFIAQGPQGAMRVTVKEVRSDVAVIDANHELAGQDLNFEIEVSGVREATEEDLMGHSHGGCCGGHCGCEGEEDCGEDCECGEECDCESEGAEKECCGGTRHDDPDHECCGKGNCGNH